MADFDFVGPPEESSSFSLSGFLSSFTTAATQSAQAINTVRGAIASVQAPLTPATPRADAAAATSSAGIPMFVWLIGAFILYKAVK